MALKVKPGWLFVGGAQDQAGVRSIKKIFKDAKFHVVKTHNPARTIIHRGRKLRLKGGTFYNVYRE